MSQADNINDSTTSNLSHWWSRTSSLPFISFIYLALPYLIFFGGWFTSAWAFLFSFIIIIGLLFVWFDDHLHFHFQQRWGNVYQGNRVGAALTILLVLGVLAVSGIGGIGFQEPDWSKHNLILGDLVARDWPVKYSYFGKPIALVYYIAYYLPSALIGRWSNLQIANLALICWSAIGLVLTLCWFQLLVNRRAWWIPLFFFGFSGLDLLGWSLVTFVPAEFLPQAHWPSEWLSWRRWDSYITRWHYTAHLVSIFWVPNQALAGWCATGLFLFTSLVVDSRRYTIFICALLLFWSPFAVIGLVGLLLIDFLYKDTTLFLKCKKYLSIPNICGFFIFGLMAVFYGTKLESIVPTLDIPIRRGILFGEAKNWVDGFKWFHLLIISYLLEFGLYAIFVRLSGTMLSQKTAWLFRGTIVLLCLTPLYVYGEFNDLAMRASIPALFFLSVVVARGLYDARTRRWVQRTMIVVVLIAALNPLHQVVFHIHNIVENQSIIHFHLGNQPDIVSTYAGKMQLLSQYVSSLDTPFFKIFARQVGPHSDYVEENEPSWQVGQSLILVNPIINDRQISADKQGALLSKFQVARKIESDYSLATRAVGADGEVIWHHEKWPMNRATSTLGPSLNEVWYDQRDIAIPLETPDGFYRVELYLAEGQEKLPIYTLPDGHFLGDVLVFDYLIIGQPDLTVSRTISSAYFGNEIALIGTDLPIETTSSSGTTIPVYVVWKALSRPLANYVSFVHLINSDGQLVAQHDKQPLDGHLPTSLWQSGLSVPDHFNIVLPDLLEPGEYTLHTGLYNPHIGKRLLMIETDASTYTLGKFIVIE